MKTIKFLFLAIVIIATECVYSQDCELPISIQLDENFSNIPLSASKTLYNSLNHIATLNGLTAESPMTPFVLTAYCDVLDKSVLPGPPIQTVYNLGLTLYVIESATQKKFGTIYIPLNGVGNNEIKSYINAFQRIPKDHNGIKKMIEESKKKMISYYDSQYVNIINEAKRLAATQKYEDALVLVFSIPACSQGGDDAMKFATELYSKYLNRMNLYVLNSAKAIWISGQDKNSAYSACELLAQIDPDAACFNDAGNLMNEIKKQIRLDIDF